jgi:hypothetical protein
MWTTKQQANEGNSFTVLILQPTYLCAAFFSIELIQKGGGTGPAKPWQPTDGLIGKVLNPVVPIVISSEVEKDRWARR